jgi:hypothetical protein
MMSCNVVLVAIVQDLWGKKFFYQYDLKIYLFI